MNEDTAIKVENVSKTFKLPHEKVSSVKSAVVNFYKRKRSFETQQALNDISFEVKKGEFFGIVGRNGSGKSTLLKLLAGIYTPTTGSVQSRGKLTPFIELGVGFNPELTGRENIFLNGALLGFNRKEMGSMYDDIVRFAELERFMDQKLKNYSSGMQVRLGFSIAIRAKGDILLLDEVLAVGDASFQQKCYNYFEELKRQKKTVVFVSHDMGAVRRFCTRAIYIDDSELTFEGSPSEVANVYTRDNLESAEKAGNEHAGNPSKTHTITCSVTEQANNKVLAEIVYKAKDKDKMYIGISVIKDGISVAEINTLPNMVLTGSGKLSYTLDTGILNAGVYSVTAALFKLKNKQLITFTSDKSSFMVQGDDPTRGAAIKLDNNWTRGKG